MATKEKKGGLSLVLAASWWVADGLYKDQLFAWAKPMMPDLVIHPPVWSAIRQITSFGPPIVLGVIGFYFIFLKGEKFTQQSDGLRRHFAGSKRMMLWVALTFGILTTTLAGVALWWSHPSQQALAKSRIDNPFVKNTAGPPVEWRFDKPATIFFYSRKPGEAVLIEAIVINGTNKSGYALKGVKATIVADMQDHTFEMRVNPHGTYIKPDESATLIPPGASFDLMLGIGTKGLSAEDFLNQYSALKFTFEYTENGSAASYAETFSRSYIEDQIAFLEEKTKAQRAGSPHLEKRSGSSPMQDTSPAKTLSVEHANSTEVQIERFVQRRERFTIAEAACLLAGSEIRQGDLVGPSCGCLYDLKKKIVSGSIQTLNIGKHEISQVKMDEQMLVFGSNGPRRELRNDLEISKQTLSELAKDFDVRIPGLRTT